MYNRITETYQPGWHECLEASLANFDTYEQLVDSVITVAAPATVNDPLHGSVMCIPNTVVSPKVTVDNMGKIHVSASLPYNIIVSQKSLWVYFALLAKVNPQADWENLSFEHSYCNPDLDVAHFKFRHDSIREQLDREGAQKLADCSRWYFQQYCRGVFIVGLFKL